MSLLSSAVQHGLAATLSSRYRTFQRRLNDPGVHQTRLLDTLTRRTARTEYGQSLGLIGGESYKEFTRKVPVVTYDKIEPWIQRQASSEKPILVSEPIVIFEETSGSSGPSKLIPYTRSLLSSFNRLFQLWLYDLLANGPKLQTGRTFLSISPAVRDARRTASGVPIGFDNDTQYLSGLTRRLLSSRFLMPPSLSRVRDPDQYRRILATQLTAVRDLEIISIWSPTYLFSLLDYVSEHRTEVLKDLEQGSIRIEGSETPLPQRADSPVLFGHTGPIEWMRVWPNLQLLSCWTDGAADLFTRRLRREFPGIVIQGKGLLATEAPITVPLFGTPAAVPLLDEVFLEFEAEDGRIRRLHELEIDGEYELIVSQKAGLIRYRMNDRVGVVGRRSATPCLSFLGRARSVSDLVGEKLHERFVREAIRRVSADSPPFTFLVPVACSTGSSYYLCITEGESDEGGHVSEAMERELMRAFQYRQARHLGQLGPVRAIVRRDAQERYTRHLMSRGMRWGEIKYETLIGPVLENELAGLTA